MTAQTVQNREPQNRDERWCCGTPQEAGAMIHLGNHPEVGVCVCDAPIESAGGPGRWTIGRWLVFAAMPGPCCAGRHGGSPAG